MQKSTMNAISRWVEDQGHRWLKPEVSMKRQFTALGLFLVATAVGYFLFDRVDYAWCHFVAGMGVLWLFYWMLGTPRGAAALTVFSIFYNELVWDLAKSDHPNVDWDQLAAGLIGAAIGYVLLIALRPIFPGRAWKRVAPADAIGAVDFPCSCPSRKNQTQQLTP